MSGIFASSFVKRLDAFVLLYGLGLGIGNGMNYMVPVVCGWEYFPNYKGRVAGILMGAFGFSSFILTMLSTAIVNPNDEKATIIINKDLHYFR